ncbi:hypothetical protein BDR26DRAFT_860294 [Obelidium mucronatum]|nr:hypothetical protein BDR26DRAFT_860294 [Obelidium mucronatum]
MIYYWMHATTLAIIKVLRIYLPLFLPPFLLRYLSSALAPPSRFFGLAADSAATRLLLSAASSRTAASCARAAAPAAFFAAIACGEFARLALAGKRVVQPAAAASADPI